MDPKNDEVPKDGGGGFTAEHPVQHQNRPLMDIARELISRAQDAEARAEKADDAGYCAWRGRTLRIAASLVYEVCGRPDEATEALHGSHR